MKNLFNQIIRIFLILIVFSLTNCEKDDTYIKQETIQKTSVKGGFTQGKNIPNIINYLKQETNGTLRVSIKDKKTKNNTATNTYSREDSALGEIYTEKVITKKILKKP